MKKITTSLILLFFLGTISYAQKKAVEIVYSQDGVSVVLDERLVGANPRLIKVDFELSKNLIFFKRGYYTQRVEIESDVIFEKIKVDLVKKPKSAAIPIKTLLKPDTLLISSVVTNLDETDIWEIINRNFIKNNYYIGNSIALFPGAKNEIQGSRFKLAIEVVKSKQVSRVYKNPRFMMAYIMIRWALLDVTTNEVTYFEETEGSYFVRVDKPKGWVVSEKMKIVMEGAIKEAQFKLLTDDKFKKMIQEK